MAGPLLKCFGTIVLVVALTVLHGSLWFFRPHQTDKTLSLNQDAFENTYHSSRKVLQFNSTDRLLQERYRSHDVGHAHEKECSELRHLNNSEECCQFVKSTESCKVDDGFIPYIQIPYCLLPHCVGLAFVLMAFWLVFLFITLGVTADDYFCPSLTVISKTLRISQNIAGVTFLAYGNGAPDIFSTLAAFSQSKNESGVQLGIQALFGAGMFVTTVVVAVISFVSTVTLTTRPFTRDVLFYLGAVAWAFITLYKENITLGESIGFVAFYVVYILMVIVGHYLYQHWKRKLATIEKFQESQQSLTEPQKLIHAARGSSESDLITAGSVNEDSSYFSQDCIIVDEPHTLADALLETENTFFAPAIHSLPKLTRGHHSASSDEQIPLLGRRPEVRGWRKFLQGLEPIDREEWSQSNCFWKFFAICKAPAVFFLNLTIPVVDYDKEDHNWNKWLNVLHCITMPVFSVMAMKGGSTLIGGRFPVWSLALCCGLILALIVATTTRSDRRPYAHSLFAYLAFVVSVTWIYTTANEIVNLLQAFGNVFGLSDAILGLTFLAWGNSIGDLVSNSAMARQGFSRMAVSACFGGPLLNMLLGIGISCTVLNIKRGKAIPLLHRYHQYVISAGFLAASLSSSAIIIPLMGFRVPRMYGVYLILLYSAYLIVSVIAEVKHL